MWLVQALFVLAQTGLRCWFVYRYRQQVVDVGGLFSLRDRIVDRVAFWFRQPGRFQTSRSRSRTSGRSKW